jgi:hypothetical protein
LRRLNGGRDNQVVYLSNILAGSVPAGATPKSREVRAAAAKPAEAKPAELPKNQSASAIINSY